MRTYEGLGDEPATESRPRPTGLTIQRTFANPLFNAAAQREGSKEVAKGKMTKKTPNRHKTSARKSGKAGKMRPSNTSDQRVRHGINSLDKLLKQDLDKRLSIARKRDKLEAELIDQAGGPDRLTPTLILQIRRIVHKALICDQTEKMALLNKYNLSDKRYIALSNSLRLDLAAFENMLKNRPRMRAPTLAEILETESHES